MPQPISAPTMPPVAAPAPAPAMAAASGPAMTRPRPGKAIVVPTAAIGRGNGAEAAADGAADTRAFGGLGAEFGLGRRRSLRKWRLRGLVAHDEVHVLVAVAAR